MRDSLLIAAGAFVVTELIPDLNSGAVTAVWLRVARSLIPALVVLVSVAWSTHRHRPQLSAAFVALGTTVLMSQSADLLWSGGRLLVTGPAPEVEATSTSQDTARVFESLVPPSDIIATNHLCSSVGCPQPELSSDAEFAVSVGRRFYVAAPLYALAYSGAVPQDASYGDDRVALSIAFGINPTRDVAASLRAAGVRWYVAERARSEGVDFSDVGDVRYENADYVVVELRDP